MDETTTKVMAGKSEEKKRVARLIIDGELVLTLEEVADDIPKFTTDEMWEYFA